MEEQAVKFSAYGATDKGKLRRRNEDAFFLIDFCGQTESTQSTHVDVELKRAGCIGACAVCDGMGGTPAGNLAASMAVEVISDYLRATLAGANPTAETFPEILTAAVHRANRVIQDTSTMDFGKLGMGTTCTLAGIRAATLWIAQVGDSRAYILRKDDLEQITNDQSLLAELIRQGIVAEKDADRFNRNIILQALGMDEDIGVVLSELALEKNDRLLLCTDGLFGVVGDDAIKKILAAREAPRTAVDKLISLANDKGGPDNVTAIVIDITDGPETDARATIRELKRKSFIDKTALKKVRSEPGLLRNLLALFGGKK